MPSPPTPICYARGDDCAPYRHAQPRRRHARAILVILRGDIATGFGLVVYGVDGLERARAGALRRSYRAAADRLRRREEGVKSQPRL